MFQTTNQLLLFKTSPKRTQKKTELPRCSHSEQNPSHRLCLNITALHWVAWDTDTDTSWVVGFFKKWGTFTTVVTNGDMIPYDSL